MIRYNVQANIREHQLISRERTKLFSELSRPVYHIQNMDIDAFLVEPTRLPTGLTLPFLLHVQYSECFLLRLITRWLDFIQLWLGRMTLRRCVNPEVVYVSWASRMLLKSWQRALDLRDQKQTGVALASRHGLWLNRGHRNKHAS